MEKEEKKKVVINRREIEVPEGYKVVIDEEGIKVVPDRRSGKEPTKVVQAGTDVPESVVRELRSVGLEFDEEKMRRNVATIGQVEYFVGAVGAVVIGIIATIVGILISLHTGNVIGVPFVLGGLFFLLIGVLMLEPLIVRQDRRVYPFPKTEQSNYTDEEWKNLKEGLIILEPPKTNKE